MPKAKRTYTEEQKQAMRERLAAARAKKAALAATPTQEEPTQRVEAAPAPTQITETVKNGGEDTQELLRQALEAVTMMAKMQQNSQNSGPQIQNGRLLGTVTKYSIDPADYPSPVERLKNEPRLAPMAFPLNYDIDYKVTTTAYENKDGINYIEPKFSLELQRIIRDELTGEATGGRYVLCRLTMHEDPQAAIQVARDNNIDIDEENELAFLNEMRYIRIRDWLFESFFQPISTNNNNRTEMVVGGKVVEFFEINDQTTQKLPFGDIKKYR